MNAIAYKDSALGPYRVLDLTEGGCMLGAKMLADLGADVIKIEPTEGSPSRIAPFYKDIKDPERSLFWFTYNANKRGITLDLNKSEGQELFKKLVETADIVIESFEPGHMEQLGLGYDALCKVKSDIIVTSITFFGQNGPRAHYKGSELTAWASSGYLYACGNPDRAPTWITFPQAGFFGGAEAAVGTMTALWHRNNTNEGQHVDVSIQECMISPTFNVLQMWDVNKVEFKRVGGYMYVPSTGVRQPIYFNCNDGYVMILVQGGNEPFVSSSTRLVEWMDEEGMAPDWLKKLDWRVDYNAATMGQHLADNVGEEVQKFTLTKSKKELYEEGAIKRRILIAPVSTTKDVSEDIQLQFRGYWLKIAHPELEEALTYCGPFIRMSQTPIEYRRRAPLIGEHNEEVYGGELGVSKKTLADLKQKKAI
jgi:crotonobetainyl-CoA:carnitine CoA-transferase CaiB-like acyl-CoA transferase